MTMTLTPKSSAATRISSLSIDKFIKSQKNLAKSPPKLWPHDPKPRSTPRDADHVQEISALTLDHPILRRLNSCNSTRGFNQVHVHLIVCGLSQHSLVTSQALKKLCASFEAVPLAVSFFKAIQEPDAFLCNTIMRAYLNANDPGGAVSFYYEEMIRKCVAPNHYTFPVVIKGFVETGTLIEGEKIHGRVMRSGLESDLFVRNSLISMYSFFGEISAARQLFDSGFLLDLVGWNSMIDGYVKNGEVHSARELFDEMPERDVFSWNSMLSGYAAAGDMEGAKELFETMPCRDVISWNYMIDGFARTENALMAREFFNRMSSRNVVSWNTILALYVRCKDYNECLRLFDRMLEQEEIKPNEATLVSVLTACTSMGDLDKGKSIHSYIKKNEIQADVLLWTSLLTMYSKCGALNVAKDVFDEMPERSVVSWNSMIMGYGIHGQAEEALKMFLKMEKEGSMPNDATFVCVLSACKHAGMVFEGWWYFNLMSVYKIEPKVEHYGCMVDLLGRAGLMEDSAEFIKKVPTEAGSALWGALLSACRTHSNLKLGEIVAKRLIELEPMDIGPYILLSNIYAGEDNWDGVENVRMMMKKKGLQKAAGSSLVHAIGFGSETSPKNVQIHRKNMLYSMLGEIGSQIKLSYRNP